MKVYKNFTLPLKIYDLLQQSLKNSSRDFSQKNHITQLPKSTSKTYIL